MTSEHDDTYATFAATIDALKRLSLGLHNLCVQPNSVNMRTGAFVLNYRTDTGWAEAVGLVYKCRLGYYCVEVEQGIWNAPIAWSGPNEPWDASTDEDTLAEFATNVYEALTKEKK